MSLSTTIRTFKDEYSQIQSATAPADNSENQIGSNIDVRRFNIAVVGVDYSQGDESYVRFKFYTVLTSGGTERQMGLWGTGTDATFTADSYKMASSADRQFTLDMSNCAELKITAEMPDGTPTGTIAVEYLLTDRK